MLIITLLLSYFATAFGQPKAIQNGGKKSDTPKSVTTTLTENLNGRYLTDTVNAKFVLEDQEGYLKRSTGKLVTRYFIPTVGAAIIVEQKAYNAKWEAIREDTVYDVKQIPK